MLFGFSLLDIAQEIAFWTFGLQLRGRQKKVHDLDIKNNFGIVRKTYLLD